MGTIRKRANGRFQVVIRRLNYPPVSRTFTTKTEATRFERLVESQMDAGIFEKGLLKNHTVTSVIEAYISVVTPIKPIGNSTMSKLRTMASALGNVKIEDITVEMVLAYAQERVREVKPVTLSKQMYTFAKAVDRVCLINNITLNPHPIRQAIPLLSELNLIGASDERDRLPSSAELRAIRNTRDWVVDWMEFALMTAMRQSEIFGLLWEDVDFEAKTIQVGGPTRRTKNNKWRVIPMFKQCEELLRSFVHKENTEKVFPHPATVGSVSDRFALVCDNLKIDDLRFHDLRHYAITQMFKAGMSIPEVALVSGHSDWRQLKRYTNLVASDLLSTGINPTF
jgi:integrase